MSKDQDKKSVQTNLTEDEETKAKDRIDRYEISKESMKHPLENTWSLWYFKQDPTRSWEESQIMVHNFCTVEDFWALYNHIEYASKLKVGCDYSLFKEGIKPMWEDEGNNQGGRWIINLSKQQRATELDTFWREMLLLLIGEAFENHSDEVCGAVVNIRGKGDKVGVWTRDAKNAPGNMKIGETLKERLKIPRHVTLGYQAHTDSMVKSGSTAKNRYSV